MEKQNGLSDSQDKERINKFVEFLSQVVYIDDLFPPDLTPDCGVREPRRPNPNDGPRVGKIALAIELS